MTHRQHGGCYPKTGVWEVLAADHATEKPGLEFEIVHEVSDNVGLAFFMLRQQHIYVVMAT